MITVKMTDIDIIERAARLLGVSVQPQKVGDNCKPIWRARVTGRRAEGILREILPYMGKRRSARINELLSYAQESEG